MLFIQSSHAGPSSSVPGESEHQLPTGVGGKDKGMDCFQPSSLEISGSHWHLVSHSATVPCGSQSTAYVLTLPYAESHSTGWPAEEC